MFLTVMFSCYSVYCRKLTDIVNLNESPWKADSYDIVNLNESPRKADVYDIVNIIKSILNK